MTIIHATCIAVDGRGVLLLGRSGAGKSDLALRLLDRGAELVSDDGTMLERRGERLLARAGPNLSGLLEVRGLGILPFPARAEATVALAVALDEAAPRMAEAVLPVREWDGVGVPLIALAGLEASAPFKVEKALALYGLPA